MAASSSSTRSSSPSEKPLDVSGRSLDKPDEGQVQSPTEIVAAAAERPGVATEQAQPKQGDDCDDGDDDDDDNENDGRDVVADSSNLPTYESIESSQRYAVAKTLLNNGDFEDALATIAEGLEEIKELLLAAPPGEVDPEMIDFHPSLAPYHYLYGTTLLYSVEESTSDNMMQQAQPSEEEGGGGEDPAEDTEIAYENLDIARIIVEQYLNSLESNHKTGDSNTTNETKSVDSLKLDLAQIRLREGDLQRLNGQYQAALQDYQASLELRQGSASIGPYDRKLADVHYNLGLAYSLMLAEAGTVNSSTDEGTDEVPSVAAAAAAATPAAAAASSTETTVLTPQELEDARRKAAHHYLQCGRILAGQLALLAEQNADDFLQQVDASLPAVKTTGEDEDSLNLDSPSRARLHLSTLRRHVTEKLLPLSGASVNAPEMASLLDVMQEIQETMDEAEASEAGVQQVAQMKAAIAAAAAASGDGAAIANAIMGANTSSSNDTDDNPNNPFGGGAATAAFGSQAAAAMTARSEERRVGKECRSRWSPYH